MPHFYLSQIKTLGFHSNKFMFNIILSVLHMDIHFID